VCGIAGLIDAAGRDRPEWLTGAVQGMTAALQHRGPDGRGCWIDAPAGLALGHRRLAIIDLSDNGRQPFASTDGRLVLTYNGEIYNYRELRGELEQSGRRFRSASDTEVLIEACAAWGVRRAVERLDGIFAFALWDRQERTLYLARDHLGVKPLYWGQFKDLLLFGSELKALRAHPGWTPEIDPAALAAYLQVNYVPGPQTIYRGVSKLPAGTLLTWRAGAEPRQERYWDARDAARGAPLGLSDTEATAALEARLREVVARQMVSDVPVGVFLSGGVDSSIVASFMQAASTQPVRSFTIGFEEPALDEAPYAEAVARRLGTQHTALQATSRDALDLVPRLARIFDEPFADSSQIPMLLVSRLAGSAVKVVLSGDGGDEVFAGYTRYVWGERVWRSLRPIPAPLRRAAAGPLRAAMPLLPRRPRHLTGKLVEVLGCDGPDDVYRRMLTHWPEPIAAEPHAFARAALPADLTSFIPRMQLLDTLVYLPDDILTKVDRASMAHGLETRVPLLDPTLFAFAWRLDPRQKVRQGKGKFLLREVLKRHLPPALVDRGKQGFAPPVGRWLRGPLKDWAEALLHRSGLIPRALVEQSWREHQAGARDWQYRLWTVLMFEAWHEEWGRAAAPTTSCSASAGPGSTPSSARLPPGTPP
jgi:asparagine synthase (glutamine-hydrolysing)